MDPSRLIPSPDTIPAPWGVFEFLLILTFLGHLLFMNAMLGTAFIAMVRELATPSQAPPPCRDLAGRLTHTVALAVNFGVAPLLFLQVLYGTFIYTSSILVAAPWLAVIGCVIGAYASAYLYKLRPEMPPWARRLSIGTSLLLMLAIAFIFVNNLTLMQTPHRWLDFFPQPDGLALNLSEPTLLPRFFHFLAASVAVGGLLIAIVAQRNMAHGDQAAAAQRKRGMQWFTFATLVEAGTGIPFLFAMPRPVFSLFVGGLAPHTLIFVIAMLATLACLYLGVKERVWPAAWALLITVVAMILVRELARMAYLARYFHPSSLPVAPQWSPLFLFLVILLIGVGLVAYMLVLAARVPHEGEEVAQ
ncbi:MAG: hypothetical protein ACOY3Z_01620 [Thermodesulfobacteriota bacterium]